MSIIQDFYFINKISLFLLSLLSSSPQLSVAHWYRQPKLLLFLCFLESLCLTELRLVGEEHLSTSGLETFERVFHAGVTEPCRFVTRIFNKFKAI